jgi:hypothetical protein
LLLYEFIEEHLIFATFAKTFSFFMFPQVEDMRNSRDVLSFPFLTKEEFFTMTPGLISQAEHGKAYLQFVFQQTATESSGSDANKWIGTRGGIFSPGLFMLKTQKCHNPGNFSLFHGLQILNSMISRRSGCRLCRSDPAHPA